MKKLTALLLVFSILGLSGNMYAEKKGADLIIQKADGTQVRGELIAVKENSLLLLERDSGADATVGIEDVSKIKIVKKGKLLAGLGLGFITGGITALVLEKTTSRSGFDIVQEQDAWVLLAFIAGIGVSYTLMTDKVIKFEGKSDSEVQEILEKLRKKARVSDYQ